MIEKKKSVGAIIIKNNKYLLQKRDTKKKIFFPGFWGVFGGSVEKYETEKKAILRELNEELSLKLKIKSKLFKLNFKSKFFKKERDRSYFQCEFVGQKTKIKLNEGQKFGYFKIEELKKLNIIPWDLQAIIYYDLFYVKKKKLIP